MWDELKRTALLGTSKHQLPEKELAYLKKLGLDMSRDPALVLLDGLAMWSNMKKVGLELKKWDTLLDNSIEKEGKHPTLKLADAIRALFKYNGFDALIPQTVELLAKKETAFPSELYPELISYFKDHTDIFQELQDILEERFYWLVKQNPSWKAFGNKVDEEVVETTKDLALKALAMQQFVHTAGDDAIGYVYNEWESYSKALQRTFLSGFKPEASDLSDSLFQKIADEKDKDTYRFALRHFSRTSNATHLDLIAKILNELVSVKGNTLIVNEDAIKKIKDIFLKKHLPLFSLYQVYEFEEKNLLFNFFSLVPIPFLCEHFDSTWPILLARLQEGDEFHELILLGLCYSAGQDVLSQELFLQTIISGKFPILEEVDLLPVYANMSTYQLEKLYEALVSNKFSFKDNAVEMLMMNPKFNWPNELVKQVMKVLPVRLLNANDSKSDPNFIMFKNMILNCDPNLYSYINAAFQANPVYSWNSTKIIEKQLKILKMRWQILKEL